MSILRQLFEGNKSFQEVYLRYVDKLPTEPVKKLAILTCVDTRLNPIRIFHLNVGDAIILRNAGNLVTTDVVRSLIASISHIDEIVILGHTNCSLTKTTSIELALKVPDVGGDLDINTLLESDELFQTFSDEATNVLKQVQTLHSYPEIPPKVPIHGILFDTATGKLQLIVNGYRKLPSVKRQPQLHPLKMPSLKMPILYSSSILKPLEIKKKSDK